MIQFIYGNNRYLIQKKLRSLEADFAKIDSSGLNLERLDGADLTFPRLDQALSAMPFLAPKRLTIVTNLLLENKDADFADKLISFLDKKADSVELVFIELGSPDKRTKLYKYLLKNAEACEVQMLEGAQLGQFITSEFKREKIEISRPVCDYLMQAVGNDMQRLESEIAKLSLYIHAKNRHNLERQGIDMLVTAELNPNVFAFTEAIARKDAETASRLLAELLENGENEQKLMGTIAFQFRSLLMVKDAINRGISLESVASEAKVKPYVLTKNLAIARKKTMRSLIIMLEQLRRTDAIIKSSAVPPDLALNILVITLCR